MSARVTRKRARTELDQVAKEDPEEPEVATQAQTHSGSSSQASNSDPQPQLGDEHGNGGLERDAEFWIGDGTIILVAQKVEFRYYRALLADHSPVFKTLFAADKQPTRRVPIDEHQFITCPVVQLTDSPQDLRHIIRAYISGAEPGFLEAAEPTFDEISAYIRLGRKYDLETLYEHALAFLEHHYPDDFKTWTQSKYWGPEHWPANAAVGVVNLARLIDAPHLLPSALLSCTYMKEDIMEGFGCADGTRETLALDDIGRCFRASAAIRQATVAGVVRTLRDKACQACKTQNKCADALRRALQGLDRVERLLTRCPIRLMPDDLLSDGQAKLGTCADCTAMVKRRSRKERTMLWARLPGLLGVEVPGWPEEVVAGAAAPRPEGT
ncbi:hypothetical protein GSI_12025 [Ganoderma sinense ZZ0214-1]|uniref:BTB domain-containing protein n=1 Tax=Ganoderma sinense ZZ0214-1 TaxID=1077348 RepID=A0A2G8RXM0_9APHY|nr:hypothetical protein GSI_12025 [Ganoderma sinense ZZ0214-1]